MVLKINNIYIYDYNLQDKVQITLKKEEEHIPQHKYVLLIYALLIIQPKKNEKENCL